MGLYNDLDCGVGGSNPDDNLGDAPGDSIEGTGAEPDGGTIEIGADEGTSPVKTALAKGELDNLIGSLADIF